MSSLDDLRAALEFLNKFDPDGYETARRSFIAMTNELRKISPALDIAVRQSPIGDESATKRIICRRNELNATIAKAHQIAMYLPPKGNKKINARKILCSMKVPKSCNSDCKKSSKSSKKKRKYPKITYISERTPQVISTYEDNILNSNPYIPQSSASTSVYREPQRICLDSDKKCTYSRKCAYPSCQEPTHAGSMYCQYHYGQEMYLSK